jgi:hypothetical protein
MQARKKPLNVVEPVDANVQTELTNLKSRMLREC